MVKYNADREITNTNKNLQIVQSQFFTVAHYYTCLGHPGQHNTDRTIYIYVVLPKVAKASKKGISLRDNACYKLRQGKQGFIFVFTIIKKYCLRFIFRKVFYQLDVIRKTSLTIIFKLIKDRLELAFTKLIKNFVYSLFG